MLGQFLHLIEDTCTVSGINWKFPFGEKILRGNIYTFDKFENKKDIRPTLYEYMFIGFSFILFVEDMAVNI
jgi:membrane-bound metal-dependent hydrolase YbcI (DUF457 family)